MINKEMIRRDLSYLCEDWGVEVDEYVEFMALARYGFNVANVKAEVEA